MIQGAAAKVSLPSRNTALVSTGVTVESNSCYVVVHLVDHLAAKGLVIAGRSIFENGEIAVHVVNAGREIVEIADGQEFLEGSVLDNVNVGSWEVK